MSPHASSTSSHRVARFPIAMRITTSKNIPNEVREPYNHLGTIGETLWADLKTVGIALNRHVAIGLPHPLRGFGM
jgi:hypothetical protein